MHTSGFIQRGISSIELIAILATIGVVIHESLPEKEKLLTNPKCAREQTVVANVATAKLRFSLDHDPRILDYYARRDNDIAYSLVSSYLVVGGRISPPMDVLLAGTGHERAYVNTCGYPVVLE